MRSSIALLALLALPGCGGMEPELAQENPVSIQSDGGVELELSAEQQATLEAADIHDGSADKIVGECGRCALAMPGDEAYAVHAGEYELHFCSDSCKAGFEADPEKGIAEMQGFLDADQ